VTVKVVTVFGLSGVGKSWMISRYAAATDVAHIQASQLMREARAARVGRSVTSEDLRRGPVLDNQTLLTDPFASSTPAVSLAQIPVIRRGLAEPVKSANIGSFFANLDRQLSDAKQFLAHRHRICPSTRVSLVMSGRHSQNRG
jgi:hypothetical protein